MDPLWYYSIEHPALAPDGCRLATTSSSSGPPYYEWLPTIHVSSMCEVLHIEVRPPNHTGWVYSAAWSRDGRWLAFAADGYNSAATNGIWILDTTEPTSPTSYRRVAALEYAENPAWTPDGEAIVYSVNFFHLYRVSVDGGMPILVEVRGESPSCGPNGAVVYTWGKLFVVDGAGNQRQLTFTGRDASPAWSPDGKWIAFASDRSGNWDIWVIAATGGTAVQVTHNPSVETSPSWAGDGRLVFMSSTGQNDSDVWLATDLPDWTTPVENVSWGAVKRLFR
jgi:Tol biopolymer transport system component